MGPSKHFQLSTERFSVVYKLSGNEEKARTQAEDICVEQTVEFPADLLPDGDIPEHIVGRLESLRPLDEKHFEATISYAVETARDGLTQLLNTVFGNISIKPGVRLMRLDLSKTILGDFSGPRFGRDGLRSLLGIPQRPLLCTALKPMGLSPSDLAGFAERFATGGIDLIKDDHGLANQSFCRFRERVERCAQAVRNVGQRDGSICLYMPNVTAPADQLWERVHFAKRVGAGGLLLSPGLVGLDTMRQIAEDEEVALPILSHPALLGSYVVNPDHGISHFALFGQIMRLAGADACIFPNYGGRFSFTEADCRELVKGTTTPMGHLRPIFPTPAGGMQLGRIDEMLAFYGSDIILLIGGDLHRNGPDLAEACRRFKRLVQPSAQSSSRP